MSNKPNMSIGGDEGVIDVIQIIRRRKDGALKVSFTQDPIRDLEMLNNALNFLIRSNALQAREQKKVELVSPLDIPKEMMGRG